MNVYIVMQGVQLYFVLTEEQKTLLLPLYSPFSTMEEVMHLLVKRVLCMVVQQQTRYRH